MFSTEASVFHYEPDFARREIELRTRLFDAATRKTVGTTGMMDRENQTGPFDYVIVGAGSAGCVMAARLSEKASCKVLLLEAGGSDKDWRIDMPLGVGALLESGAHNWNYLTEPEPHLNNRRVVHPRGRVLGGSSSINGMVYTRGHGLDYDNWAKEHGYCPTSKDRKHRRRARAPIEAAVDRSR